MYLAFKDKVAECLQIDSALLEDREGDAAKGLIGRQFVVALRDGHS